MPGLDTIQRLLEEFVGLVKHQVAVEEQQSPPEQGLEELEEETPQEEDDGAEGEQLEPSAGGYQPHCGNQRKEGSKEEEQQQRKEHFPSGLENGQEAGQKSEGQRAAVRREQQQGQVFHEELLRRLDSPKNLHDHLSSGLV